MLFYWDLSSIICTRGEYRVIFNESSTSRIFPIPTNKEYFSVCTREWDRIVHLGLEPVQHDEQRHLYATIYHGRMGHGRNSGWYVTYIHIVQSSPTIYPMLWEGNCLVSLDLDPCLSSVEIEVKPLCQYRGFPYISKKYLTLRMWVWFSHSKYWNYYIVSIAH